MSMAGSVRRQRVARFAEQQLLGAAGLDARDRFATTLLDIRGRLQGFTVKARDAIDAPAWHVELDISECEITRAEFGARRVTTKPIAPRTDRIDAISMRLKTELRALQPWRDFRQTLRELVQVGHYNTDRAANPLWFAGRQMTLAAADVDPHVFEPDLYVWIARKSHSRDIERSRWTLIRNGDVDVLERNDVGEILRCAVVGCCHVKHSSLTMAFVSRRASGCLLRGSRYRAATACRRSGSVRRFRTLDVVPF